MNDMDINNAVAVVNQAITEEKDRLMAIVQDEDADPTIVCGRTSSNYGAQCMISSSELAKIALRHDFPIYKILRLDVPETMLAEIARHVGLYVVEDFDL